MNFFNCQVPDAGYFMIRNKLTDLKKRSKQRVISSCWIVEASEFTTSSPNVTFFYLFLFRCRCCNHKCNLFMQYILSTFFCHVSPISLAYTVQETIVHLNLSCYCRYSGSCCLLDTFRILISDIPQRPECSKSFHNSQVF